MSPFRRGLSVLSVLPLLPRPDSFPDRNRRERSETQRGRCPGLPLPPPGPRRFLLRHLPDPLPSNSAASQHSRPLVRQRLEQTRTLREPPGQGLLTELASADRTMQRTMQRAESTAGATTSLRLTVAGVRPLLVRRTPAGPGLARPLRSRARGGRGPQPGAAASPAWAAHGARLGHHASTSQPPSLHSPAQSAGRSEPGGTPSVTVTGVETPPPVPATGESRPRGRGKGAWADSLHRRDQRRPQ